MSMFCSNKYFGERKGGLACKEVVFAFLLKNFLWRSPEKDLSCLQVETAELNYWKVLEHVAEFLVEVLCFTK